VVEKPTSTAERFGRAVQVRRAELGLKRPDLAKRANLSYPYVSEIENGMKSPSTKALAQLADALELSPAELMVRAENLDDPTADSSMLFALATPDRLFDSGPKQAILGSRAQGEVRDLVGSPHSQGRRFDGGLDRRLEELVTTIVRAEMAAWARAELPALVRAEVERILSERGG
jgi:transcriptional regulator with XRE-family HTH domain